MAAGGYLALDYGISIGRTSGLAIGSQAGLCVAVEAATEADLLKDAAAADRLIAAANAKIGDQRQTITAESGWAEIDTRERCADFVRQLIGPSRSP
jgi:hypothetical protein